MLPTDTGTSPAGLPGYMQDKRISVQLRQGGHDVSHLGVGAGADSGVGSSGSGYSVRAPSAAKR